MKRGARGKELERHLAAIHKGMRRRGVGYVIHVPTPIQIEKRLGGNKVRASLRRAIAPDYIGVIEGGRAVVGEAKQTSKPQGFYRTMLTAKQDRDLQLAARLGAVAFVAVGRMPSGSIYLLPWSADGAPFEGACMQWEQGEQWKIPTGKKWEHAAARWAEYSRAGWGEV